LDDLRKTLELFYRERNEPVEQQDSQGINVQGGGAGIEREYRKTEINTELINTLWQSLEQRPDIRIKRVNSDIDDKEHESEPPASSSSSIQTSLEHSNKRLLATEDRMWHAIAGHAPDKAAIPPKYFDCLSVIAAHGAAGILQPQLTRLTGQQKQSVPLRTDKLAIKGYIVKKAVLARGSKTSLLKLTRFVDITDADEQAEMRGSRITRQPDGVTFIDLDLWFDGAMSLLKAQPNFLLALQDLKTGLGISKKLETRAILRCIRRVAHVGLVKKCSAMPADSSARQKAMRCVQLVREPTENDKVVWRERDRRKRYSNFGVVDESEEEEEGEGEEEEDEEEEEGSVIEQESRFDKGMIEHDEGCGVDAEVVNENMTNDAGHIHDTVTQGEPQADNEGTEYTKPANHQDVGESNGSPSGLPKPPTRPIRFAPTVRRPLATAERDRVAFERWSMITAERLIASEVRDGFSSHQVGENHALSLGDQNTTDSTRHFPQSNIPPPQQRLAQMQADLLSMARPGVYINPPGAKELKEMGRVGSGRPRNALIAVFKSEKLKGLDFFEDQMQPPINHIGSRRKLPHGPEDPSTQRKGIELASERNGRQSEHKNATCVMATASEDAAATTASFENRSPEGQVNLVLDPNPLTRSAVIVPPNSVALQSVQYSATSGSPSCESTVYPTSAARAQPLLSQATVNDTQLYDREFVDAHPDEQFYYVGGEAHGGRYRRGPQVPRRKSASESGSKPEDQTERRTITADVSARIHTLPSTPPAQIAPSAANSSEVIQPFKQPPVASVSRPSTGVRASSISKKLSTEQNFHASPGNNSHRFVSGFHSRESSPVNSEETPSCPESVGPTSQPEIVEYSAQIVGPECFDQTLFSTKYVKAHTESKFRHVGNGRWKKILSLPVAQASDLSISDPVQRSLFDKEYVNARPEAKFIHVGHGRYKTAPTTLEGSNHSDNYHHARQPETFHHAGGDLLETVKGFVDTANQQATGGAESLLGNGAKVLQTTRQSSSTFAASQSLPKKRGRPSKAMLAAREQLEREGHQLSRRSLIVKLNVPESLQLSDNRQDTRELLLEQTRQKQLNENLVATSRANAALVPEPTESALSIVRPYYEARVNSTQQDSALSEQPTSATGLSGAIITVPMEASESQQPDSLLRQEASGDEHDQDYQPEHEIAEPDHDYGATAASKPPRKRLQNRESLLQKRYSVILDLVEKCGGACPGNREMFGPFTAAWERLYRQQPDRRTFHEALKSLVDRNKLKKVTFAFRSEQGTNETGVILALPDIEPNSVQVEGVKEKIILAYPSKYIPQEVAAPRTNHSKGDVCNVTERTYGNGAILGPTASKFDRRAEFPVVEGLSVQRTKQALDLADQNAKAQGYENAKARLNQRWRVTSARHYKKKRSAHPQSEDSDPVDESLSAGALIRAGEHQSDDDWTPRGFRKQSFPDACGHDTEMATPKKRLLPPRHPQKSSTLYFLNQPDFSDSMLNWLPPQSAPGFQAASTAEPHSTSAWNIVQPKPHSLEDILEQSTESESRDSRPLTDALSRFECDIDRVEAWERKLVSTKATVVNGDGWQFINHTMHGEHIEAAAAETGLDETLRRFARGPTVDKAYVLAHPEEQWTHVGGGRWRSQHPDLLPQRKQAPKDKPTLPSYTKEYVDAHPEEDFYHVGGGRYRRGKQPEGFRTRKASVRPMGERASLNTSEDVDAQSDDIFVHVGGDRYPQVEEVEGPLRNQQSMPYANPLTITPGSLNVEKSTRKYRSRKRRASDEVDPVNAVAGLGLEADILPPPKKRRTTPGKDSIPADDADLALAIALVSLLCGGLSMNQIKWDIVSHAMNFERDGQTLKGRWATVEPKIKGWMNNAIAALREPFLAAYEKSELPTVDFLNLERTDWPTLFDWAKKVNLKPKDGLGKVIYSSQLPGSLEELATRYTISDHPSAVEADMNTYFSSEAQYVRHAAMIQSVQGTALVSRADQTLPERGPLHLVKSWCRAVCMTKPEDYDAETAARKIGIFSNEIISQAANELQKDQIIIAEKKDRQLPGRNFNLHRSVLKEFQRWPEAETDYLREVAAAWSTISSHFEQNETLELSQHTKDPEIAVLTNMVAQGLLRVTSILPERNDDIDAAFPRFGIWGVDDIRVLHNSHNVDPSRLRFPLVYQKNPSFTSQPLLKAIAVPIVPATFEGEPGVRTPFWVDVNGKLLDDVWDLVLHSVLHLLVFRPGSTAHAMETAHKGKLWRWEIELILQWMEKVGLATRCGGGKEEDEIWNGGWRAGEWWYCAFTPEIATWEIPRGRGVHDSSRFYRQG